MKDNLNIGQKITLIILAIIMLVGSYAPAKPVHAQEITTDIITEIETGLTAVVDGVSEAYDDITSYAEDAIWIKDYILDPLAWAAAKSMLQSMTNSTVNWVNSGFKGNPAFLQNPEQFFQSIGDNIAGNFISGSNSPLSALCSPISLNVRLALALNQAGTSGNGGGSGSGNSGSNNPYSCTLSQIINNVQGATINGFEAGDFSQGGWPAFASLAEPQNSFYGAYLEAQADLSSQISSKTATNQKLLDQGNGFLSYQQCSPSAATQGSGDTSSDDDSGGDEDDAINVNSNGNVPSSSSVGLALNSSGIDNRQLTATVANAGTYDAAGDYCPYGASSDNQTCLSAPSQSTSASAIQQMQISNGCIDSSGNPGPNAGNSTCQNLQSSSDNVQNIDNCVASGGSQDECNAEYGANGYNSPTDTSGTDNSGTTDNSSVGDGADGDNATGAYDSVGNYCPNGVSSDGQTCLSGSTDTSGDNTDSSDEDDSDNIPDAPPGAFTGSSNGQNCQTVTPGSVISASLNKALGSSQDSLVQASMLDEVIGALAEGLLNQVLGSGGLTGVSKPSAGHPNSYLSDLETEASSSNSTVLSDVTSSLTNQISQYSPYATEQQGYYSNSIDLLTGAIDTFNNYAITCEDASNTPDMDQLNSLAATASSSAETLQTYYDSTTDYINNLNSLSSQISSAGSTGDASSAYQQIESLNPPLNDLPTSASASENDPNTGYNAIDKLYDPSNGTVITQANTIVEQCGGTPSVVTVSGTAASTYATENSGSDSTCSTGITDPYGNCCQYGLSSDGQSCLSSSSQ